MKKEKPEIIPGDKPTRQRLLIFLALYILVGLWLEPLIDILLTTAFQGSDPLAVEALNRKKIIVASMVFGVYRTLPILLFLWLGYRVITSASLPPKRMKWPFTVARFKGKDARMFGILFIIVSLMLLYRELLHMSKSIMGG